MSVDSIGVIDTFGETGQLSDMIKEAKNFEEAEDHPSEKKIEKREKTPPGSFMVTRNNEKARERSPTFD